MRGYKMSEETKTKIRNKTIGRRITDAVKEKISQKNRGENNFFYGKTHSKETKDKLSEMRRKEVYQYSKDGILIKVWSSALECTKNGYSKYSIQKCCNEKQYIYDNCVWSYNELNSKEVIDKFRKKEKQELEFKENLSKRLKGIKISEERIEIIRKTHKGKKLSDETKEKLSNSKKGRTTEYNINKRHKIYQYDTNFKLIKIWDSSCEIEKAGYSRCNITKECRRSMIMNELPKLRYNHYWTFTPINQEQI